MSVIALTSASGSPGVTTTALGLALTRSRPTTLLDADPTGGSPILAGYLRGQSMPTDSLIDLYVAHNQGHLREALPQATLTLPDTKVTLIPGVRSHVQAGALGGLWDPLLGALKALGSTGQDTVIDLGRLGLEAAADQLMLGADLTLLVARSDLVALSGARSWAHTLRTRFEELGAGAALGVLLVGPGRPYGTKEVAAVMGVPVVATVEWDPRTAAVFSAGAQVRKLNQSPLVRSLRSADTAITAAVKAATAELIDTREGASG
ncbi:hypothetical protein [uncultured Serinicoccus sp.]|uniref:hypothetical protein n=1 Tax=uncultured Serinicoccus sp. TaxID=735514 RepID=UPI00260BADCC|nr:hypothetical protein [uncultured Serinicoccus sp.]